VELVVSKEGSLECVNTFELISLTKLATDGPNSLFLSMNALVLMFSVICPVAQPCGLVTKQSCPLPSFCFCTITRLTCLDASRLQQDRVLIGIIF